MNCHVGKRGAFVGVIAASLLAAVPAVDAQTQIYRVGAIVAGDPYFAPSMDCATA